MTYDITDVIDDVTPAVVQISVAAGGAVLGTGFLVNKSGDAVTANHVISDLGGRATVGVAVPNYEDANHNRVSGSFTLFEYDVLSVDAEHDLAVLRPHEPAGNPFREPKPVLVRIGDVDVGIQPDVVRLRVERPRDGMAIATSGYPFGEVNLITSTGYVASSWTVERDEVRDPLSGRSVLRGVADSYLADMQVNGGNSGGPVYRLADAAVIGVCVSSRGAPTWFEDGQPVQTDKGLVLYDSGISSVVPATYVADLLDDSGVEWTPA